MNTHQLANQMLRTAMVEPPSMTDVPTVFEPQSLEELLNATPEQLATADIARVNLLCATGLRGAEDLDIPACLTKIDRWTEEVRLFTECNFLKFTPKTPRDTPGFLRCWSLVKLLRHCKGLEHLLCPPDLQPGEKYLGLGISDAGPDSTYYNSDVVFIHGLLGERKLGICTAFPVLFASVGRRLGYPIKIVISVCHVFIRWDGPIDRFNMDASKFYINLHPDDYYIDSPKPWTEEEKECGAFLRPLTPTEELGLFVGWRAGVLESNARYDEAGEMCDLAQRLFPQDPLFPKLAKRIDRERVRLFMEADGWGYEPTDEAQTVAPPQGAQDSDDSTTQGAD